MNILVKICKLLFKTTKMLKINIFPQISHFWLKTPKIEQSVKSDNFTPLSQNRQILSGTPQKRHL
jgi:hypothetical protein